MLSIYWFCFSIGGIFVALSVLGGLDGVEFDLEADPDLDWADRGEGPSQDSPRAQRQSRKFSPLDIVKSLKFWTFGSCFFGLTGVVLSNLQVGLNPLLVLVIAVLMGLLLGSMMSTILLLLRRRHVDSLVRTTDLVGLQGVVEVPISSGSKGKVRLRVKGITRDFVAMTDSDQPLGAGQVVMVVETQGNCVWVVAEDPQPSSSIA